MVGILPVGNTHEDIYQNMSHTAERLRRNDAVTLMNFTTSLNRHTTGKPS